MERCQFSYKALDELVLKIIKIDLRIQLAKRQFQKVELECMTVSFEFSFLNKTLRRVRVKLGILQILEREEDKKNLQNNVSQI